MPRPHILVRISEETGGSVTPNDFFDLTPSSPAPAERRPDEPDADYRARVRAWMEEDDRPSPTRPTEERVG